MRFLFGERITCASCEKRKTRRTDKANRPICNECEILSRVESEPARICPVDQATMAKEVLLEGDLIIDRCPVCKGVWLDHEEIEIVQEAAGASSSNFVSGLCFGLPSR